MNLQKTVDTSVQGRYIELEAANAYRKGVSSMQEVSLDHTGTVRSGARTTTEGACSGEEDG